MMRCIDADKAVKRFEELHGNESNLLNMYNAGWIVSFIENLPTVDVQKVIHGKWIVKYEGRYSHRRCYCSVCGLHLEKGETRFQRLRRTHPIQYQYCLEGGEYSEDGLWQPNKQGLGMRHVFDELNKIYGKDFIRYE